MTKFFLKNLYYISFIFTFLPMLVIFIIPRTNANFLVASFFWILLYILIFMKKPLRFINFIKKIYKLKIFKFYLWFLFFGILTSIVHYFCGYYKAPFSYYFFRFINYYETSLLVYFLPVTSIYLNIKLKTLIKIFYILIYLILLGGAIQFFAIFFDLKPIYDIFEILANWRQIRAIDTCFEARRVFSVFDEPASLANFIYLILPFIYGLVISKFRLFTNNFYNIFYKKSVMILLFAVLIFTKSPIYLIFTLIEFFILTIVYQYKFIKRYFKQIIIFIMLCAIIIIFAFTSINLEETYLKRIFSVVSAINNINNIIFIEPSLGTRIISFALNLETFKANPLFGVGIFNSETFANISFSKVNLFLTNEVLERYYNMQHPYAITLNSSIFFTTLAELGFVGAYFYFQFFIQNLKDLFLIRKKYFELEQIFIKSLFYSFISLFFISFYTTIFYRPLIPFMLGLSLMVIFRSKFLKGNQNDK